MGHVEVRMALFGFGKKKPAVGLPQLCYDIAYFVLPHYALDEPAKIVELCTRSPEAAGPWFYVMACTMQKIEPVKADAMKLRWHRGDLDDEREYFVLEYPVPPPVDLGRADVVLAPHFSAMIRPKSGAETDYYILGGPDGRRDHAADDHAATAELQPRPRPRPAAGVVHRPVAEVAGAGSRCLSHTAIRRHD